MSFWDLDERAQLALLMAGLMGATGAAGCDRHVDDPGPPDAAADSKRQDYNVSDMAPPDSRPDGPPVADPPPPDAWLLDKGQHKDISVSDMVPPDAKADSPPIADPLPPDASAPASQPPRGQMGQGNQRILPLSREFRTRISAAPAASGGGIQLRAQTAGAGMRQLRHSWVASAGTLDRADRQIVRWTPPATPGRHMVQVVVRDGRGHLAVDVFLHETR